MRVDCILMFVCEHLHNVILLPILRAQIISYAYTLSI